MSAATTAMASGARSLTCTNAVNKGDVTSLGNYAGGIVSRIGGDTDTTDEAKAAAAKYCLG